VSSKIVYKFETNLSIFFVAIYVSAKLLQIPLTAKLLFYPHSNLSPLLYKDKNAFLFNPLSFLSCFSTLAVLPLLYLTP
jgi:hypothetical protein